MKKKVLIALAVLVVLVVVAVGAVFILKGSESLPPMDLQAQWAGSPQNVLSDEEIKELFATDPHVKDGKYYLDENYYLDISGNIKWAKEGTDTYAANTLNVAFYSGTSEEQVIDFIASYEATIASHWTSTGYDIWLSREYSYNELELLIEEMEQNPIVEWVHMGRKGTGGLIDPQDMRSVIGERVAEAENQRANNKREAEIRSNRGIKAIKADKAWEYIDHMSSVNVGVLDSSISYKHEDLKNTFKEEPLKNFMATDDGEHGTHVAGIIGAEHNSKGVAGVFPKANLYGVSASALYKLVELGEIQNEETLLKIAFNYLLSHNAKVINVSMGDNLLEFAAAQTNNPERHKAQRRIKELSDVISKVLLEAMKGGKDFVICTSSGNQGEFDANKSSYVYSPITEEEYNQLSNDAKTKRNEYVGYAFSSDIKNNKKEKISGVWGAHDIFSSITDPQIRGKIISVGATDKQNNIAYYSQVGNNVDILAPGSNINSTIPVNAYREKSGTSMASPHVAGVAAMLFSVNPNLTGEEVKDIIIATATGEYGDFGHKLVDAEAAVKEAIRRVEGSSLLGKAKEAINQIPSTTRPPRQTTIKPTANTKAIPAGYTPIYTAQDLDNVRKDLTKNYILMNDIDHTHE